MAFENLPKIKPQLHDYCMGIPGLYLWDDAQMPGYGAEISINIYRTPDDDPDNVEKEWCCKSFELHSGPLRIHQWPSEVESRSPSWRDLVIIEMPGPVEVRNFDM